MLAQAAESKPSQLQTRSNLPALQPVCELTRLNIARWDRQHKHLVAGRPLAALAA